MARKSIAELLAQADATLPDNATQLITAAAVRNIIKDFVDTMAPSYGVITCASSVEVVPGGTPQVIAPFTAVLQASPATEWSANLTNGSVTRALNGVAGNTSRVTVDGDVEGPNNNLVEVRLYKNGAYTGFSVSATTGGAGRPFGFNFLGLIYNDADATFDVRAVGDAATYTFSNVDLICENVPVRSFV